uniref:inositol-phosphate phosphatase n=1 Tax=Octactis speculum TaxID=3111310 RepID=A0A7S2BWH7_9STRA|mmetsp:Transcript_28397/g.38822  ORF Transcript_28397/g.38822 Transcript_28397/m.38822 type:complete len:150 (+) Transcript_28397:375-824(+)
MAEELFYAQVGLGAYLGESRLATSGQEDLSKALIVQEFGYQRSQEALQLIHAASRRLLAAGAGGVRQFGSGVLDLCWVACGRVDAVYAGVAGEGWSCWDHAAGSLLITEAGGVVTQLDGSQFQVDDKTILACATNELRSRIQGLVNEPR